MNEKQNKRAIPKEEEYRIKYVFRNESTVDVNEVIKECFRIELNTISHKKIAL